MTRKGKGFLIVFGMALCLSLYAVTHSNAINSPRHLAAIERTLKPGISKAEAFECIAVPPGHYYRHEHFWMPLSLACYDYIHWKFDGYSVHIHLDKNDTVTDVQIFRDLPRIEPSRFQGLLGNDGWYE